MWEKKEEIKDIHAHTRIYLYGWIQCMIVVLMFDWYLNRAQFHGLSNSLIVEWMKKHNSINRNTAKLNFNRMILQCISEKTKCMKKRLKEIVYGIRVKRRRRRKTIPLEHWKKKQMNPPIVPMMHIIIIKMNSIHSFRDWRSIKN